MSKVPIHSDLNEFEILDKDCYKSHGGSDGSNLVCIMKRFPTCHIEGTPENYQNFHLRFYFPKKTIANDKEKVNRIVVMINGINEIDYFTIYDQLGEKFAAHNLASVLLPLPDHFNRHPKHRKKKNGKDIKKPSDELLDNDETNTNGPKLAYRSYLQIMSELDILIEHLRYESCPNENTTCRFFKKLFSPQTKVSILGYSLGASVALAHFICNYRKYNTCFNLSGGIKLGDLKTKLPGGKELFPQKKWDNFVLNLENQWREGKIDITLPTLSTERNKEYRNIFEEVYFGLFEDLLVERLKNHTRKVLFILGEKDSVISYDIVAASRHGLSMFKIPGLDHLIAIENEWSKWNDVVVDLINSFEKNAAYELLTHEDIIAGLLKFERKYKIFEKELLGGKDLKYKSINLERIDNEEERFKCEDLLLASMAYYKEEELFNIVARDFEKNKNLLGKRAIERYGAKEECVNKALVEQSKDHPNEKIGEILIRLNCISPTDLGSLLSTTI
ncbi:MAG: hypothetical protein Q8N09_00885 [Thermodesulfovibrionia bacterium]|nr:hypothetical protein [Thermodesulfovibrionia bacterium]